MLRKLIFGVAALALVAVACGNSSSDTTSPAGGGGTSTASCDKSSLPVMTSGTLTIGTDNPVFGPWFGGTGTYTSPAGGPPWKANPNKGTGNPASGKGYESAFAYDLADQLGFSKDEVAWSYVGFNESYKPGPKPFDFYIGQVSYLPERANAVDFSDSYYDVQQALVAKKGSELAKATSFADIKPFQLGAQVGTTSYKYITDNIQPDNQAQVFDTSTAVLQAFNNGTIDGYVVDAPTAYVNVLIGEAKDAVVVGQFPTIGDQEYDGVIFQKGSALVDCVNQAIQTLKDDGTMAALQEEWLKNVTYPEIQQ